jgi:hypothetical protein
LVFEIRKLSGIETEAPESRADRSRRRTSVHPATSPASRGYVVGSSTGNLQQAREDPIADEEDKDPPTGKGEGVELTLSAAYAIPELRGVDGSVDHDASELTGAAHMTTQPDLC